MAKKKKETDQEGASAIAAADPPQDADEDHGEYMLPRASDFLGTGEDFEGCIAVEVIEGKELVLAGFDFFDTQWGDTLKIIAEVEGEDVVILSWSKVLVKQAHKLESHLPLLAKIERVKRYWRFV